MTVWQTWTQHPQRLFLRRAALQIHLWVGVTLSLYLVAVCLTGSILVYRNELYRTFSPQPVAVTGAGPALTKEALQAAAMRAYPGFDAQASEIGEAPAQAVEVQLQRDATSLRRLFDPYSGRDLGDPLPVGFRFTAWMLDLHDNLLGGPTGRQVNGAAALAFVVIGLTGAVIWWPGVEAWRRSLTIDRRANWKRLNWSLHSALGFWFFPFVALFAVTGAFLGLQPMFAAFFDYVQPLDDANPQDRFVDSLQYWLTYLHFGRLGGRGIPGCGRGLCNEVTKAIWAVAGFIPVPLAVTGIIIWWNRIVQPALRRADRRE